MAKGETMSLPLEILSGRVVTSVEIDGSGALMKCGSDISLRVNVLIRRESQPQDPSTLVGNRILSADANDETLSLTMEDALLTICVDDLEPGIVEAVILSAPSLIVVWP